MSNSEMAFNSSGTREKSKMSTFSLILASFLVINTGMTPVSMCQRNITCPVLFLYFWAMLFSIAESASLLSIRQTGEYASTVMPSDWKYLTSFLQVLKDAVLFVRHQGGYRFLPSVSSHAVHGHCLTLLILLYLAFLGLRMLAKFQVNIQETANG